MNISYIVKIIYYILYYRKRVWVIKKLFLMDRTTRQDILFKPSYISLISFMEASKLFSYIGKTHVILYSMVTWTRAVGCKNKI
jgi:hypothetical protein